MRRTGTSTKRKSVANSNAAEWIATIAIPEELRTTQQQKPTARTKDEGSGKPFWLELRCSLHLKKLENKNREKKTISSYGLGQLIISKSLKENFPFIKIENP